MENDRKERLVLVSVLLRFHSRFSIFCHENDVGMMVVQFSALGVESWRFLFVQDKFKNIAF